MIWTGERAAAVLNTDSGSDRSFSEVSTDTRTLRREALFVALTGEHFDGHGFLEAAREAGETARQTFEQGSAGEALPTIEFRHSELAAGVPAFELLKLAGLAASNSEARRLIKGGGARINDAVIEEETRLVTLDDINEDGVIKLAAGKKRHALIRAQ